MTLIDTMAKAMFDRMAERIFTESTNPEIPHMVWEDESEQLRDDWRQVARDGLKAIHEPTPVMKQAAVDLGCNTSDVEIWQAMLDAELAA